MLAGVWAGPLFVGSNVVQVMVRDGFDLRRHPLSQLMLGGAGWVQSVTFVVVGLAVVALAVGLREQRATAVFVGGFGAGLAAAGLFVPDAANGFPAGAPAVVPMSWHGVAHATAAVLAFLALAGACVVHAVRAGRRRAVLPAVLSGIVAVVLLLPTPPEHASVQLAVTGLVSFGWTTAIALNAIRGGER
ncbi:DUF998 domain-containing protein [Actinoplanes sp. LDG1-01]|uniref:DUF998 domain-containing protein n=1 Tax=Paractinoplanes lichenicola TaxID=2802976 RepID=A0ABS1VKZ9_9ACTN|nr:DUF998 domain-containing protein [Actinoplanes lichenicola]